MKQKVSIAALLLVLIIVFNVSCLKEMDQKELQGRELESESVNSKHTQSPPFNFNVKLYGRGNTQGHLKFKQDPNPAKIIDLDIKVHNLAPNHEYLLQRAVDAINVLDGNCTSTSWLTLGKGLEPQPILTDNHGKGSEELWRDISAIPSGSTFDIHFRVIDAVTMSVVLSSDCHQYTVR